MKKLTLKGITIVLLLFVSFTKLSAQESNSALFNGAWELTRLATNGSESRVAIPGLLKFFDADGKFFNMRITQNGSIITHQGNYVINDNETYSEIIKSETQGATYPLAGKTYKLRYKFSDDKKLLVLNGMVEGKDGAESLGFTEVWKRVENKIDSI
jgi:hypothetical protein